MKHVFVLILASALLFLAANTVIADEESAVAPEHQMVIKLIGDDYELPETDISHLEVGDGETIYTESGKRIDLLRSQDGVEVYIDGELVDTGGHEFMHHDGDHQSANWQVEVICDNEQGCDHHEWISDEVEVSAEMQAMHEAHGGKVIVLEHVILAEED